MSRMRKHLWLDILAGLVVVAGVAGLVIYVTSRDKSPKPTPFPTASMIAQESPTPSPSPSPTHLNLGTWPTYGYDNARTRFDPDVQVRPPFRIKWRWRPGDLLEFPPSIYRNCLYICTEHGYIWCITSRTHNSKWRHKFSGKLASAPTIADGKVYITTFSGMLVVIDSYKGKILWKYPCGSSESSPLVYDGRVYFGNRSGLMSAVDIKTHKLAWKYQTGGKITGAPALLNGRIVIGSYDGSVYCFSPGGQLFWRHSASGVLSSDAFYATPALAYDTAYIGSIGNRIYAFDLQNGGTRWSYSTGAWVYSSPAVWHGLVFEGSYDGYFYALGAANGRLAWRFNAGGKISGSPSVIDGVVYVSTISNHTWGLDARTGKVLWSFPDGAYTPIAADAKHLYFCGAKTLYCLMQKGQ